MISFNEPFEAVFVCNVFTVVEVWPVVTIAVELDNFRAVVGAFVVIMGNVVTVVTILYRLILVHIFIISRLKSQKTALISKKQPLSVMVSRRR